MECFYCLTRVYYKYHPFNRLKMAQEKIKPLELSHIYFTLLEEEAAVAVYLWKCGVLYVLMCALFVAR